VEEPAAAVSDVCASCGAPIVWARHERTGKPAPIDKHPRPGGNVEVMQTLDGVTYRIVKPGPGAALTNHFATCHEAEDWRGK